MKILCYGDSNTWGHDPATKNRFDESIRWPKLIQKMLGKEYEIIEEGLCGRTAAYHDDVIAYRHGLSMIEATLDIHQPIDLVIIMLGTNDLKTYMHPDPISISKGIRQMIRIIKNPYVYNPHMKVPNILVISPIHIGSLQGRSDIDAVETFGERGEQVSKQLAYYYEKVCKEYGCAFMDASLYAKASNIDAIHMDAFNHQKLAEAIVEKIKEIQ